MSVIKSFTGNDERWLRKNFVTEHCRNGDGSRTKGGAGRRPKNKLMTFDGGSGIVPEGM